MTINVKNALKNPGDSFPLSAELSFPPEDFQGEVVFSSVHLDASYCSIGGNIELKGTVSARLELICSRCLESFVQDVECPVEECFSHQPVDDMLAISASDTIDIDICIRNSILMSLELLRVCSPHCKGLCPVCGVNRNEVSCTCGAEEAARDNPFSVLHELLNNEEV